LVGRCDLQRYDGDEFAGTPAALAAVDPVTGLPTNELYDPTAYSDLTTASPKYIINLGALLTMGKLSVNLLEKNNARVTQYPTFSPFGINGGFYYVKGSFTF
jgi:hypothetical protein